MFFAGSEPAWANKFGGSWFATHPPLEERVRALDARVTPLKFRTLVSDERRKLAARAAADAAAAAAEAADSRDGRAHADCADALGMVLAGTAGHDGAAVAAAVGLAGTAGSLPADEHPRRRRSTRFT